MPTTGELCSENVARTLGITNIDDLDSYSVCEFIQNTVSTSNEVPFCVFTQNAGYGFTKKKSGDSIVGDDICITAECPTGFKVDPNDQANCLKPRMNDMTIMNSVVEERWYDWFMIPDYHIGNKYENVGGSNYAPCKKGSIPTYEQDRVDNLRLSILSSKNEEDLGKCIEKSKYFGGKYLNSDTYCPLAWVYRVGATNKDLKTIYNDLLENIDDTKIGSKSLDDLRNDVDKLIYKEIYEPVRDYGFDDYIGTAQSEESKNACMSVERGHPERREKAFQICSTINEIGKDGYIEKLMRENNEDEKISKKKYKRAIQACHTLFCNDDSDQKLCFPEVEKQTFDNTENTVEQEPQVIDPEAQKAKIASGFLYTTMIVLFIGVAMFAIVLFGPNAKIIMIEFWNKMKALFRGSGNLILGLFGFTTTADCIGTELTKDFDGIPLPGEVVNS